MSTPVFELVIKDLQSPSLPLGHAAKKVRTKIEKGINIHPLFLTKIPFILNMIQLTFSNLFKKDSCFFKSGFCYSFR
jgi:hypothetical protein